MNINERNQIIMVASGSRSNGTLFLPIFECENDIIKSIELKNCRELFKNNGFIYGHDLSFKKNQIIIADIYEDTSHFEPSDLSHSLYQIDKSSIYEASCIIFLPESNRHIFDNQTLSSLHLWEDAKIYLSFDNMNSIGPYSCMRNEDNWIASKPVNKTYLSSFALSAIYESTTYFKYRNLDFFFPNKIPQSAPYLALSTVDIIKRLLKNVDSINSFKIQKAIVRDICKYLTSTVDTLDLYKKSFPKLNDFNDIKNTVQYLFAEVENAEPIINEINSAIKSHPLIKPEIERCIDSEVKKYIDTKKKNLDASLENLNRKILSEESKLKNLTYRKKQLERSVKKLNDSGKQALIALRSDYDKYVKSGKEWRNSIISSIESIDMHEEDGRYKKDKSEEISEKAKNINNFNELRNLLISENNYSEFEYDLIKTALSTQFWCLQKELPTSLLFNFLNMLKLFGLSNRIAWMNISAEHITTNDFMKSTCFCYNNNPVIVGDFISSKNNKEWLFLCIFGSNRSPIEGYIGPIIRSIQANLPFPINNRLCTLSPYLTVSLCFDSDSYTAKLSQWVETTFPFLKIPEIILNENEYLLSFNPLIGDNNDSNNSS
ncbi:MAG: hypothetical protein ACTSXK_00520 [Promethearchaeota archaeon]